jgi:hypothetical protein
MYNFFSTSFHALCICMFIMELERLCFYIGRYIKAATIDYIAFDHINRTERVSDTIVLLILFAVCTFCGYKTFVFL